MRIAIIGTSHTQGSYHSDNTDGVHGPAEKSEGWCIDVAKKYNCNTWIFSHGGGGIQESILYLNIIKKYFPENFFDKIIIEISTEPRIFFRTSGILRFFSPFEFKNLYKFVNSKQAIDTINFPGELVDEDIIHFSKIKNIIPELDKEYKIMRVAMSPVKHTVNKEINTVSKYVNLSDGLCPINDDHFNEFKTIPEVKGFCNSIISKTRSYWRTHFTHLLINSAIDSLEIYKTILNVDMLLFQFAPSMYNKLNYCDIFNNPDLYNWSIVKQEAYIDWLKNYVGIERYTLFLADNASHLTQKGQEYLVSKYLKNELDKLIIN